MSGHRKLAAILVADIVGYSRLTSLDEDRTLARLRTLRSDLIDPTIAVYNGRVVKRTGDGALVEFRSVVEAVRCAIEIQDGMLERNAGLPDDSRIEFRTALAGLLTFMLILLLALLSFSIFFSSISSENIPFFVVNRHHNVIGSPELLAVFQIGLHVFVL
jgi:hypothetical protein